MAFCWWADDDPLIVVLGTFLHLSNKEKKTLSELDPLWQNFLDPHMAHLPLVLEVPGSIPARGEEKFRSPNTLSLVSLNCRDDTKKVRCPSDPVQEKPPIVQVQEPYSNLVMVTCGLSSCNPDLPIMLVRASQYKSNTWLLFSIYCSFSLFRKALFFQVIEWKQLSNWHKWFLKHADLYQHYLSRDIGDFQKCGILTWIDSD